MKKSILSVLVVSMLSIQAQAGVVGATSLDFKNYSLNKFGIQFNQDVELRKESPNSKVAESTFIGYGGACILSRNTTHDRVLIKAEDSNSDLKWKFKSMDEVHHSVSGTNGYKAEGQVLRVVVERQGKGEMEFKCHNLKRHNGTQSFYYEPIKKSQLFDILASHMSVVRQTSDEVLNDDTALISKVERKVKSASSAR